MRFYTKTRLSENIHETPEGFLVCVGVPIGRTGEMIYGREELPLEPGPDGTIVVVRSSDDLFSPKTVASFEGKSFTVWHPNDFINPENWRELTKGVLFQVRRGSGEHENDLLSDILVTDVDAIRKVKSGMREVSLGYDADYVSVGAGRYAQRKIIGNHCALVDEGRAGAQYAINDHKGKGSTMKLRDRIKSIFGKAQDDALALVEEAEKKGAKTEDEEVTHASTNDAVMKSLAALEKKIDAIGKKAKTKDCTMDENGGGEGDEPAKPKAKDEGAEGLTAFEARLTKLEGLVTKLVEKMSMAAADEDGLGDDEETTDDDMDGDDETTDEDESEKKPVKTGDRKASRKTDPEDEDESDDEEEVAARVEILAPGMNARTKDAKRKALVAAYQTKDGKRIIERFTAGRKPNFNDKSFVSTVFVGAAELLASERTTDFSRVKANDGKAGSKDPASFGLSPEEVNKRNEQHYASKTAH